VIIPRIQSGFFTSKRPFKPLGFVFIVLGFLGAAVLFAPRSGATPQAVSTSLENQSVASGKRRRPEFVPGEALVRFKKNRAFEGATYVVLPNNEAPIQAFQRSGSAPLAGIQEQIPVNVDRFEGSDLVDGLRIARMAQDDTLKAIAALRGRDDVLYAEPNYIVHTDLTPNDPRFLSNELYGLSKIDAPQAWNTTTGSNSIVVGVVDEGIELGL
jgi:hypothetical protein